MRTLQAVIQFVKLKFIILECTNNTNARDAQEPFAIIVVRIRPLFLPMIRECLTERVRIAEKINRPKGR